MGAGVSTNHTTEKPPRMTPRRLFRLVLSWLAAVPAAAARYLRRRVTIMLVPHTERAARSVQINIFAITFFTFLFITVLAGFAYLIAAGGDADRRVTADGTRLRMAEASLDSVREEVVQFLQVYDDFTAVLADTLRRVDPGAAGGIASSAGTDLAALLRTDELGDERTRQVQQLQRAVQTLRGSLGPLGELSEVIGLHGELLRDIPNLWPVMNGLGHVTMEFGPNIHPFLGTWYMHRGLDIWYYPGTPIISAGNGVVWDTGFDGISGFGWFVEIDHNYGFRTKYTHLSAVSVRKGQEVTQGQRIGTLGSSGTATGPHLHFEIQIGNEVIDPAHFLKLSRPGFARPTVSSGRTRPLR